MPISERCGLHVVVDPALGQVAGTAFDVLNAAMPMVELRAAAVGPVSIAFGGEWPSDPAPLAWTSPDRRTVLVNPDHPATANDSALAEVIAHEFGHVLLGGQHTTDGTLLDPQLDGVITIGDADRAALRSMTCSGIGLSADVDGAASG
ncbi:MAG: hypothetical protein ACR2P0_13575 [Acidimicrobiales bacterium]